MFVLTAKSDQIIFCQAIEKGIAFETNLEAVDFLFVCLRF